MRDVHECDGAAGDDNEFVDPGHCRDVQRYELALRERELAQIACVEEHVPCRSHHLEYGPTLHDPLRALLYRESYFLRSAYSLCTCLRRRMSLSFWPGLKLAPCLPSSLSQQLFAITPLNWAEWKAVLWLSAPVLVLDEVLKFVTVSLSRRGY